jgi:hypothetical protein
LKLIFLFYFFYRPARKVERVRLARVKHQPPRAKGQPRANVNPARAKVKARARGDLHQWQADRDLETEVVMDGREKNTQQNKVK